jgi:hypothetical protein
VDDQFEQSLRMLGRKHDVVAVVVQDQAELQLPNLGVIDIHDAETGELMTVDTSSESFQRTWATEVKRVNEQREKLLKLSQVDRIDVNSSSNYVDPLVAFFRSRHRK